MAPAGVHHVVALDAVPAEVRFDLVVSDVVMPRMSGFELWKRTREMNVAVPFLFISGYVDEELEQTAPGDESAFLAKPFSPEALVRAVSSQL